MSENFQDDVFPSLSSQDKQEHRFILLRLDDYRTRGLLAAIPVGLTRLVLINCCQWN